MPTRVTPIIVDGSLAGQNTGMGSTASTPLAPSGPDPRTPAASNTNNQFFDSNNPGSSSVRERAVTLQKHLDKFLEYCSREVVKLEWASGDSARYECAKFLLDRVIVLYVYEVFPDIEHSGVDVFEGWEGSEESPELLDTSDPVVIARYWLIRWIINIASLQLFDPASVSPGLPLFRQVGRGSWLVGLGGWPSGRDFLKLGF
jgi:hypothetical protein